MSEIAEGHCPLPTRDIVDRIVHFIEIFSEVKFYTYQNLFCRRIVESILENDGAIITGLFCRQSGKTETLANTCMGLAIILPCLAKEFPEDPRLSSFAKGFLAGIYAPIKEQAEIAFSRMRHHVTSEYGVALMEDPELDVGITIDRADTLAFSNGSVVIARSASPDTQIEGKTFHVVFLDETQKLLRAKVEKEIRPMLAATFGTMICIGTAWESRGGFHVYIQRNLDIHRDGGKRNHFEFPYDIVISEKNKAYEKDGKPFHLNYEKFVNQEMYHFGGKDNAEFRMNFMCLWQESRVIAVRQNIFREAAIKDLEAGPRRGGNQVAGLDVGKINDPTVLTVMTVDWSNPIRNPFYTPDSEEDRQNYFRKTIVDWLELDGSFEGETGQYRSLIEYLMRTGVEILVVDSTSIGDPVFERIDAMIGGNIRCVPFKFSHQSKSNLYRYYLTELHSGRIRYAAGTETQERYEYRKFQYEHLDLDKTEYGGYAVCRAPDGGHDDYPDSAALACWAEKIADQVRIPEIQVSSASEGGDESRRGYGGGNFMGHNVRGDQGAGSLMDLSGSLGHRSGRYIRRR